MRDFRRGQDGDNPKLNAESTATTTAEGSNTHGTVNQHPSADTAPSQAHHSGLSRAAAGSSGRWPFRVGVSEDRNKRWRRTMEDAHAFIYDFGGVHGQGFFSVFDGHAGKQAAEFCGAHFHEYLLKTIVENPSSPVPDILNATFQNVDRRLSELAKEQGSSSGCTAVTAFLRLETEDGKPAGAPETGGVVPSSISTKPESAPAEASSEEPKRATEASSSSKESGATKAADGLVEVQGKNIRRVLYTANVGDARAVLCRGGKAVRLTYDHKGQDAQETKRIQDAGGFVMNNRVNGVLAVTRSLGDSSMKDFVVGAPYTTETTLGAEDTFLIVACDGLWDVAEDQDAVNLIADVEDPQKASEILLKHALDNFSTDNTSVMVVRFAVKGENAADLSVEDPKSTHAASQTGESQAGEKASAAEASAGAEAGSTANDTSSS
ncbi:hypothetical protein V8E36_005648 [Tilletia maclaganii]